MLRRFDDWPRRLHAFIRARREMPFEWGRNDCCTFALEGNVVALTGIDLLPGVPRPASGFGAARFLRARGHEDATGLATELLGEPIEQVAFAQRGDVVALPHGDEATLGVCVGADVAAPALAGLEFFPVRLGLLAWRV